MKKFFCALPIILSGCGLFDSDFTTLVDDYSVGWIDSSCSMTLYNGPLAIMEGQIYQIGWNEEFIIAKRHPDCNRTLTDYFIVDIKENQKVQYSQTAGVYGPLSLDAFNEKLIALGVPSSVTFNFEP